MFIMLGMMYRSMQVVVALLFVGAIAMGAPRSGDPSVEDLKARLTSANIGDKPHLCLQIAQLQLAETDKLYAAAEVEKAEGTLTEVVAYSELARDYAIQSRKHQKQTEIAVRGIARKLNDVMHILAHDERKPVQDAINRLQRVRDDLLIAMFPKGAK